MGIANIAVMPLQALVDFFAPRGAAVGHAALAPAPQIYWARQRLGQAMGAPGLERSVPAGSKPFAMLAERRANMQERPWLQASKKSTQRVVRTGFALPAPGSEPQTCPSVRMRRTQDGAAAIKPGLAGRMVISGRMRDVCAALNGLAD